MKHLKKFNESERVSILDDQSWTKLLPKKLTLVTENGEFTLEVKGLNTEHGYPGIYNLMNSVSFIYDQNTVEGEDGDATADGEPDTLQFDIAIVKDNKGDEANPSKSLRLNIDLTYGDSMMYAFTIDYPNKVHVHHYNGKDSLYDSEIVFTDDGYFPRFIILKAKNIRLVGVDGKEGEVTIQASKQVNMDAPTVSGQGTNISFAGANKTQIAGTSLDLATSTKASCASGVDTDSSSIMGKILKAIKDFKQFFTEVGN